MELERCIVLLISAALAFRSFQAYQFQLSAMPAALLSRIGLESIIGVRVLADAGTESSLPTTQRLLAYDASFGHWADVLFIDYSKYINPYVQSSNPSVWDHAERWVWTEAGRMKNVGPVAQSVRAGDSSLWCAHVERHEMNGMNSGKPS